MNTKPEDTEGAPLPSGAAQTSNHLLLGPLKSAFQALLSTASNGETPAIRTGIFAVDEITGGLRAGELTVLAGTPGIGKTAFALQVALALTATPKVEAPSPRPRSVTYFSLESSRETLALRLLAHTALVERARIFSGHLSRADWDRLTDHLLGMAARPILVDDASEISTTDLRARVAAAGAPSLVVVDFVQMMPGVTAAHTRDQQLGEVTRGLKSLAKDHNLAVLALSQMNRAIEARGNGRPQLSDLRDSGALAHDADNVWFLHLRRTDEDDELDITDVDLVVAKHRNGCRGSVRLLFDARFGIFREPMEAGDAKST